MTRLPLRFRPGRPFLGVAGSLVFAALWILTVSAYPAEYNSGRGLGWSFLADGEYARAQTWFARSAKRVPHRGSYKIGYALSAMARGEIDHAAWAIDRALTRMPSDVETLDLNPELLRRLGDVLDNAQYRQDPAVMPGDLDLAQATLAYLNRDLDAAQDALLRLEARDQWSSSTQPLADLVEKHRRQLISISAPVVSPPTPAPQAKAFEPPASIPVPPPSPAAVVTAPSPAVVEQAVVQAPPPVAVETPESNAGPREEVDFVLIRDRLGEMSDAVDRFSRRLAENLNQTAGELSADAKATPATESLPLEDAAPAEE